MSKFKEYFKEDFELARSMGQKTSSGQGSVGPAKSNHNDLFSSVADAIPEEENRKSHDTKVLPFPLDRIITQLVDTYECLIRARFTLQNSLKSGITIDSTQKDTLKKDIEYVNKCINAVKLISKDVEAMKF
jgi:hypothetical protein